MGGGVRVEGCGRLEPRPEPAVEVHEARARHGAAMMAPDYTHWHGMYEVADRFYQSFIPEAREIARRAAERRMSRKPAGKPSRKRAAFENSIGLVAFGVVIAAWFWMMRQPPQAQVSMGMPQVVFVTAAAIGVASLIAELRAMTLWDVVLTGLEWIVSAMAGQAVFAATALKNSSWAGPAHSNSVAPGDATFWQVPRKARACA